MLAAAVVAGEDPPVLRMPDSVQHRTACGRIQHPRSGARSRHRGRRSLTATGLEGPPPGTDRSPGHTEHLRRPDVRPHPHRLQCLGHPQPKIPPAQRGANRRVSPRSHPIKERVTHQFRLNGSSYQEGAFFLNLRRGGVTTRPPVRAPGPGWPAWARFSTAGPLARSSTSATGRRRPIVFRPGHPRPGAGSVP